MNVLDILRSKGIEARKAASTQGGEYWSACPGCGGDDRFHVWPDQNGGSGSYWCRQCGKHGDNIQFLIDFDGKNYPEACRALDIETKKDNYQTPKPMSSWIHNKNEKKPPGGKTKTESGKKAPPDLWIEKASRLVDWAHESLLKSRKQMRWLADRGIKKEAVIKFRLGWNPGKDGKDLWRPRESWGLATEMKAGRKKKLWLPRGLVIPLLDAAGKVVRIRVRRPKGEPRYYVIPGSSMEMLVTGKNCRAYMVVESELDAILLWQTADELVGSVALGSASAKPGQDLAIMLQACARILLAMDYDTAGAKAMAWWKDTFVQSIRWPVLDGKDPGEAFAAGVDIKAWVSAGLPPGWLIGRSVLGRKKRAPASRVQGKQPVDVPAGVMELAELLKKHPVMIHNSAKRTYVRESQGWVKKNWEVSKRICELVYMTPEVFEYIERHPVKVINGHNLIK